MPGAIAPVLDSELQAWTRRVQAFAHEAFGEKLRRLRVRLEDKEAIAALHWRGVPDEDDALAAIEEVAEAAEKAGFVTHWGRKVLEIRPPVRIDKGAGIVGLLGETDLAAAVYVGDDVTDLDAFRGLTRAAGARPARLRGARRRALRRDAAGARGGGRHARRRPGGRARAAARPASLRFGDFLKATVLLSAASATLLAALTVIGLSQRVQPDGDLRLLRLVGARHGDRHRRSARATRRRRAIANLLAGASTQHSLPDISPARTIFNRLWPLLVGHASAPACCRCSRRRSAGSRPASRSSGRSPGGARRPRWPRSRSATAPASTSTGRRR